MISFTFQRDFPCFDFDCPLRILPPGSFHYEPFFLLGTTTNPEFALLVWDTTLFSLFYINSGFKAVLFRMGPVQKPAFHDQI
jgi:hypothetical protein